MQIFKICIFNSEKNFLVEKALFKKELFKPKSSLHGKSQPDTKGVLDMGGASTQIVYVPSGNLRKQFLK